MAKKKKRKRNRKAIDIAKSRAAGMARATHGRKTTFQDRKKEQARRACRVKIEDE